MEKQIAHIIDSFPLNYNVKCIRTEKPDGWKFIPGQATEISVDREGWREEGRPFTFTSLPEETYLEFIIKEYPDHNGVTEQIHRLGPGDRLILNDVFGDISYQGKGLFIAGGAGLTPFVSILRERHKKGRAGENRLLFGNRTHRDIFLQDELRAMLGDRLAHVLSDDEQSDHLSGFINRELIVDHLKEPEDRVYFCGPPAMMDAVMGHIRDLDIEDERVIYDAW